MATVSSLSILKSVESSGWQTFEMERQNLRFYHLEGGGGLVVVVEGGGGGGVGVTAELW